MQPEQAKQIAQQLRKPEGDAGIETGNWMSKGNKPIYTAAMELINPKAGQRILELGMGNGYFVKDIVSIDTSIQYVGCDYSATMVLASKQQNTEWIEKGQVMFHHTTADALPLPDDSIDTVLGINIVYFWEQPATELAEIRRVLKPGGSLILGIRPRKVMELMPFTQYGFTLYSRDELTMLLNDNGFTVTNYIEREEDIKELAGSELKPETLILQAVK